MRTQAKLSARLLVTQDGWQQAGKPSHRALLLK
jgi:hypothetical protein